MRPCLQMAVVFVLGEAIICKELGLAEKGLLCGALFALYFGEKTGCALCSFLRAQNARKAFQNAGAKAVCDVDAYAQAMKNESKERTGRGAKALLLVLLCLGAGRYFFEAQKLDAQAERAARFGQMQVRLCGEVERCEASAEQTKLTIKDGRLSSAYGRADALPKSVAEKLSTRYDVPVGRVLVYIEGEAEAFSGQWVCCEGSMFAERAVTNEGMFDGARYYRSLGISARMSGKKLEVLDRRSKPYARLLQQTKKTVAKRLRRICDALDAGTYQAILLGDKTELDTELSALYQENGIAHIIAISGLHLSVIGMGFYRLLRRAGLSGRTSGCLSSLLIVSYGILTGSSGSAMRAVIMMLCRFLAEGVGRSYDMLSAIGLAALLLLWQRPYLLFASGFQLSFMAVLSLAALSELARAKKWRVRADVLCGRTAEVGRFTRWKEGCPKAVLALFESLKSSAVLQLATLPIVLFHYFQFPIYGIFLNLLVIPLMGYVLYAGLAALALGCFSERLAYVALGSGHYILRFYSWLCRCAEQLPHALWVAGRPSVKRVFIYYALLLFLYRCALLRQRERALGRGFGTRVFACALLGVCLWLMLPRSVSGLSISMLDVRQGDGLIFRKGGCVLTMDLGSSSDKKLGKNVVEPYLKSQGIVCIDAALISHADADHTSGMLYLLTETDSIAVKRLILPEAGRYDARYDALRAAAEARAAEVLYMGTGAALFVGEGKDALALRCFYPTDASYEADPNRHSSGILLSYGTFSMLLTGDMDQSCEQLMLAHMRAARDSRAEKLENVNAAKEKTGKDKIRKEKTGVEENGYAMADEDERLWEQIAADGIKVLKVGHHGSKTSTSMELLAALRPACALVSYGNGNSYGHPHKEVMERLLESGASVLETGKLGRILIWTDGELVQMEGYRQGRYGTKDEQ